MDNMVPSKTDLWSSTVDADDDDVRPLRAFDRSSVVEGVPSFWHTSLGQHPLCSPSLMPWQM